MALLLLPILHKTAHMFGVTPRITIVSSALHKFATLPSRKEAKIFDALRKQISETGEHDARYNDTKLLIVLYGQELARAMSKSDKPAVTINWVNPGYCLSELIREKTMSKRIGDTLLARSTDEGARTLVDAVISGKEERHGKYINDMKIGQASVFLNGEDGKETGKRVWAELNEKLENIQSGILNNI